MSDPIPHDEPQRPEPAPLGSKPDVEDGLLRLYRLSEQIKTLEAEKDDLRDQLAAERFGSAYFASDDHEKRYGYVVEPEKVVVDPDLLDDLDEALLDEVAPRKLDTRKMKQAIAAGRITEEQVVRYLRIEPGTPHIRFGIVES